MRTNGHFWRVLAAIVLLSFLAPAAALADARSDYLVRLLNTSDQFRVRAQAALSLGRVQGDPAVIDALTRALRDDNASVRAAAAASLETLGNSTAIEPLRGLQADPDTTVRAAAQRAVRALERVARTRGQPATPPPTTPPPSGGGGSERFYVGVGLPGTKAPRVNADALRRARDFLARTVDALDGVALAPDGENAAAATRVIRERRLVGYFLDSSIVSIEERPDGAVRATVSVIVGTYPGRDMRSILQGSATVSGGGTVEQSTQQAIEAAMTGACRQLVRAMEASAGSARAP